MNKRIGDEQLGQKITVLSVGPLEKDHAALSRILATATSPVCPDSQWTVLTASSLPAAISAIQTAKPPLVICDTELGTATWRDLWQHIAHLPDAPFLIVASRHADEYLWAEALNLGAYDVLAKPFDPTEAVRSLSQAWLQRACRRHRARPVAEIGRPQAETQVAV